MDVDLPPIELRSYEIYENRSDIPRIYT